MKMQKRQFRIGELAQNLGIEKFVIRFWEKEFQVGSQRSQGGQRFYQEDDLKKFQTIKTLLYDQGFTIAGAKKQLKNSGSRVLASQRTTLTATDNPDVAHSTTSRNALGATSETEFFEKLRKFKKQLLEIRSTLS